jgi:hypothetical protein
MAGARDKMSFRHVTSGQKHQDEVTFLRMSIERVQTTGILYHEGGPYIAFSAKATPPSVVSVDRKKWVPATYENVLLLWEGSSMEQLADALETEKK